MSHLDKVLPTREEEDRPAWCRREGFISQKVLQCFFFYCANTFLLHRQAGMLTHKPCKELKLARADSKKTSKKFLQNKKNKKLKYKWNVLSDMILQVLK